MKFSKRDTRIAGLEKMVERPLKRCAGAEAEISRLREALGVYDNEDTWIQHEGRWCFVTDILPDGREEAPWEIARRALGRGGGIGGSLA